MRLAAPILLALANMAAAASAGPKTPSDAGDLVCTADTATNASTGDPVPAELRVVRHRFVDMMETDGRLTGIHERRDAHGGVEVVYSVERATGRFTAWAIETRNDIGEEHRIELAGKCVADPAAAMRR